VPPVLIALCGLGFSGKSVLARAQIAAILAAGQSLIYDDLLLERDDRRKLASVAQPHRAELVLVYLDTPLAVISQRLAENARTGTRDGIPGAKLRLDASLLEPPDPTEQAIYVRPADAVADVIAKVRSRLPPGTGAG
jgi:predicted kinase